MNLDLRMPMGLMFTLTGALLTAFGLASRGTAIYALCQGVDVNLCWGLVLLVFGLVLMLVGSKGQKKIEKGRELANPSKAGKLRQGR
jgi:Na+-transporting NADH:ubiquinone oxidoreductase subunit NqrD